MENSCVNPFRRSRCIRRNCRAVSYKINIGIEFWEYEYGNVRIGVEGFRLRRERIGFGE